MKTNYVYKLLSNLNDVSDQEWDSIGNGNLFITKNFLNTTALTNPSLEHRWVTVRENGDLLGALYFQLIPFDGNELKSYRPSDTSGFFSTTKQAVIGCVLEKIQWKLAVLGNVFITGEDGQHFKKSVSSKCRWVIISEAAELVFNQIEPDAVLITDIYETQLTGSELMVQKKFRNFSVEPDMILKVPKEWTSFDDYLSSISSKYRVRAKKVFKNSKAIVSKSLSYEDCTKHGPELYRLYESVMENVDFKLAVATFDYFCSMKKEYPDKFFIEAYYKEDEIVGFISYFNQKHQMDVHLLGLNYAYNKEFNIYQRILYDCVAIGIKQKNAKIHFGRTASVIKSTVGAKPVPVISFIKHISTLSNIAFKPLTSLLKPEEFIARNPFK